MVTHAGKVDELIEGTASGNTLSSESLHTHFVQPLFDLDEPFLLVNGLLISSDQLVNVIVLPQSITCERGRLLLCAQDSARKLGLKVELWKSSW